MPITRERHWSVFKEGSHREHAKSQKLHDAWTCLSEWDPHSQCRQEGACWVHIRWEMHPTSWRIRCAFEGWGSAAQCLPATARMERHRNGHRHEHESRRKMHSLSHHAHGPSQSQARWFRTSCIMLFAWWKGDVVFAGWFHHSASDGDWYWNELLYKSRFRKLPPCIHCRPSQEVTSLNRKEKSIYQWSDTMNDTPSDERFNYDYLLKLHYNREMWRMSVTCKQSSVMNGSICRYGIDTPMASDSWKTVLIGYLWCFDSLSRTRSARRWHPGNTSRNLQDISTSKYGMLSWKLRWNAADSGVFRMGNETEHSISSGQYLMMPLLN